MSEFKNIRKNFLFFVLGSLASFPLSQTLEAQNYSASSYRPTPTAYAPTEDEAFTWSSLNSLADETPRPTAQTGAQSAAAPEFRRSSIPNAPLESDDLTVGEMLGVQARNQEKQGIDPNAAKSSRAENYSSFADDGKNAAAQRNHSFNGGPFDNCGAKNADYSVSQNPASSRAHSQNAYSARQIQLAGYDAPADGEVNTANSTISQTKTSQTQTSLPPDFPTDGTPALESRNLIAFSETISLSGTQFQQITLVDPTQKVLCVYHINMTNGQIELKSARKIEWDLQLVYLNSQKPLPQDVQAILQQNPRRK